MTAHTLRRLTTRDSLDELADLLRLASERWRAEGPKACTDQGVMPPPAEAERGDCFVAVARGRLVGTITLRESDPASLVPLFRQPAVMTLQHWAVQPAHRKTGVGLALLASAHSWGLCRRYAVLAADVPESARRLRAYCERQGFRAGDVVRLDGQGGRSVLMSKPLRPPRRERPIFDWPPRHPAEHASKASQRQR